MSLRHSNEHLSPQANVCTICKVSFSERDDILMTVGSHRFHRSCLLTWLKRNTSCPQCHAKCNSRDFSQNTGARTRARAFRSDNPIRDLEFPSAERNEEHHSDGAASLPVPNTQDGNTSSNEEDNRVRNIVTAVISARQATLFNDLENRVSQLIQENLENTVANILGRLNLNGQPSQPAANISPNVNVYQANTHQDNSTPFWPRDIPNLANNSNQNFHRKSDNLRFSDMSNVPNSGRVAQLISNWDIKFDGSSKLTVDSFLYRIECQVIDTLGGNFNLLCEHVQSLFINEAKDWYWRYRRSVERVTWPSLCQALRTNFQQHRSDFEIKELIRNRKQGAVESFDDFRNAVLKIAESLQSPLPEIELVEILQHNLRPRVRQQLLYVQINSIAELRRLCLKGESLANEINLSTNSLPISNQRQYSRRFANELTVEDAVREQLECEIDEITKYPSHSKLICWNCKTEGHRYFDCLADRTVFCYGCGTPEVYRPKCPSCSPGNLKMSKASTQNPRNDKKNQM